MAVFAEVKEKYIPKENRFYAHHYHHVIMGLMGIIALLFIAVMVVMYQMKNRPLPVFIAYQPKGQQMSLTAFKEPNLLPETILRWASKAATIAYTFDFNNYKAQIAEAQPFFTNDGWQDYLRSVDNLISTIVQNKLFVSGVVSGTPVIANQGPIPGRGYTWRVQIPFLVTYLTANGPTQRSFYVVITIVRVPTSTNPQGIGIDQFVMVNG